MCFLESMFREAGLKLKEGMFSGQKVPFPIYKTEKTLHFPKKELAD